MPNITIDFDVKLVFTKRTQCHSQFVSRGDELRVVNSIFAFNASVEVIRLRHIHRVRYLQNNHRSLNMQVI